MAIAFIAGEKQGLTPNFLFALLVAENAQQPSDSRPPTKRPCIATDAVNPPMFRVPTLFAILAARIPDMQKMSCHCPWKGY